MMVVSGVESDFFLFLRLQYFFCRNVYDFFYGGLLL